MRSSAASASAAGRGPGGECDVGWAHGGAHDEDAVARRLVHEPKRPAETRTAVRLGQRDAAARAYRDTVQHVSLTAATLELPDSQAR